MYQTLLALKNTFKIILRLGDDEKTISILKLDVEGYEFKIIPQLLQGSMLDSIRQIIIEVHSDDQNERIHAEMKSMMSNLDALHTKGYRVISYDPNFTIGRLFSTSDQYYSNFDVSIKKYM